MQTSPQSLLTFKEQIAHFAIHTLGFDDCRFTDADSQEFLEEYRRWIDAGCHGDMTYLKDHLKFKENPRLLLKDVKSAIILIKNYKSSSLRKLTGPFKIARYAVGKDYHAVIGKRLQDLSRFMKIQLPGIECYEGVDSRPLAERTLALKAGIGFRGKNTMVIKPGVGSYFFIGVILTNHAFEQDAPLNWNCGNCRLCIDACPMGALVPLAQIGASQSPTIAGTSAPRLADRLAYSLDANKCISYQTIERKSLLTNEEIQKTEGWMFGCDICQEVCPYNYTQIPLTDWKEFQPQSGVGFDFFNSSKNNSTEFSPNDIPKDTSLYRSRKRIIPNWNLVRKIFRPKSQ